MFLEEAGENEPLPVPFRYVVEPLESKRTHVFRPNPLTGNNVEMKVASVGALWIGHWDKLPESKMAKCVWEAFAGGERTVTFGFVQERCHVV